MKSIGISWLALICICILLLRIGTNNSVLPESINEIEALKKQDEVEKEVENLKKETPSATNLTKTL